MYVKCHADDVHSFCLRNIFYNDTRGTLTRLLIQKVCNGIQTKQEPIDELNSTPRLNTYTRGLKGRGCRWAYLVGPLLTVFPHGRATLCGHSSNNFWSLRKLMLECHMHCEIDMEFEIN